MSFFIMIGKTYFSALFFLKDFSFLEGEGGGGELPSLSLQIGSEWFGSQSLIHARDRLVEFIYHFQTSKT